MSVGELSQALLLPGAQLKQTVTQQLKLWLLDLDVESVQMDAQQIGQFWQNLPYWAFAWAGGRVLAQYIVDHPQAVAGKRVLDFGCGSGLVGIAAAKAGASEVWVADLDSHALLAAKANAELNDVTVQLVDSDVGWPDVDLLLASDVLYDISSSHDLRNLMLQIPDWLLAENEQVAPDWVQLQPLWHCNTSTLPAIGDFDKSVSLQVYGRCE